MLVRFALCVAAATLSTSLVGAVTLNGNYEYIVVGSGPGGGTLASRLARAGKRTLLIEAGNDQGNNYNYQVPAFQGKSTEDPSMRWDIWVKHYSNTTQAARDPKLQPKGILCPRTQQLGGCGGHNALITIYPDDSDWQGIVDLTGDNSWNPANMRGYFEKLERCEYLSNNAVGHGFTGWLATSVADPQLILQDSKIIAMLYSAATVAGETLKTIGGLLNLLARDVNPGVPGRDSAQGLFQIPLTIDRGVRNSPREFILSTLNAKDAQGQKLYPLDVRMNCLVTKVIFDRTTSPPKAIGVEFLDGAYLYKASPMSTGTAGTPGNVTASKEVILAGGAFNTPQMLKLSGVGPASELQSFHIPVVTGLPGVGTNLQDRYESSVVATTTSDFDLIKNCTFNDNPANDPCLRQWLAGNATGLNRGAYVSSGFAASILHRSQQAQTTDIDAFLFSGPVDFYGYYPNYATHAVSDARHFTWAILKAHTGNKAGTVTLASIDPRQQPNINFHYFDEGTTAGGVVARDVGAVVEGIQTARKIYAGLPPGTPPFTEVLPGPNVQTQAQLEQFVKDTAWGHHASCTCPIGRDGDLMAVLDSSFRVRKVQNLCVVDAKVFPTIPGIFIAIPVYQIGEKAADVILNGS